jgi:omega-6 fatty acid desaturase (delta-12 desaturase)
MTNAEIQNKLKDWRTIVKKYQQPNTRIAVWQMLTSYLPFLGLWILMYFSLNWHYGITLVLAVIAAFFLVRIFIIQHDCGHQSFLKSKTLNQLFGYFSSIFSSIPYNYWAKVHNAHHGHNRQMEHRGLGDIDFLTIEEYKKLSKWGKFKYRIFRNPFVLFGIAPIVYLTILNRYPFFKVKNWGKLQLPQFLNNLILAIIYVLLAMVLGWQKFLLVHLPVLFIFGIIAFWFFYVQHQHEKNYNEWRENWDFVLASVLGSTYYKLPKIFQWFSGNIGFHHIHHLNSRIPNYYLEKCAKENPVLSQFTTTLTFTESLKLMRHKLWDQGQHRMISFRDYYNKVRSMQNDS